MGEIARRIFTKKEQHFRNEDTDVEENELSDEGYDGGCDDMYDHNVYDDVDNDDDDDDDDELDEFEDLVLYSEMEDYIEYYKQFVEPMHAKYGSRFTHTTYSLTVFPISPTSTNI